jgi:hypothetical protein
VESRNSSNQMPVVGPKSAAALREFLEHPEPPLATLDWIEAQIGTLSIKPHRKATVADMAMILKTYITILRVYPRVDLGYAFGRLLRENKWFPDISEIVELAAYAKGQRDFKRIQAATLIAKHEREWTPPIPDDQRVPPDDVAALLAELRIGAEKEG